MEIDYYLSPVDINFTAIFRSFIINSILQLRVSEKVNLNLYIRVRNSFHSPFLGVYDSTSLLNRFCPPSFFEDDEKNNLRIEQRLPKTSVVYKGLAGSHTS